METETTPIEQENVRRPDRRGWLRTAVIVGLVLIAVATIAALFAVQFLYADRIRTSQHDVPHQPVAIVLGASVKQDGTPSAALEDRILSGVDLYKAGIVDSLLMTGDDGQFHINEIKTMVRVAREAGVPDKAIRTDGHGYRTYESCKRAHDVFGVTDAVVVTQRFHLGRALYLCNRLGIDTIGYAADRRSYDLVVSFWLRDLLSSLKAFIDVNLVSPKPPVSYGEGE
ncbi:MAG TPA: ElyC/SanA/YdcF family protein [Candidatus Methylomirabilis sp.]|nr:ElyC/SanA/YdcF family protein [Candidatus Methylomirabilis sp.]